MKRKVFSILFALALVLSFSLVTAAPVGAATLEVGPGKTYATISAAIAAASAGDTIQVYPATYTEQVTITLNDLTLRSVTPLGAVITASAPMVGNKAIVEVNGATGVIIDGFTITGPVQGINYGIMVVGGGSATIQNNVVASIRDNPLSGRQSGVGILVGRKSVGTTGTALILNNQVVDFQKGGIVVDNEGSDATIVGNTIVGAGKTSVTAQNGIQISRHATAQVRGNQIADIWYDTGEPGQGQEPWWSAGLLLYDVYPAEVKHCQNKFTKCHINLLIAVA